MENEKDIDNLQEQKEKDQASQEVLRQLRDTLFSDNISKRRRAAFKLSWLQEDGMEVLQQVLTGSCPKKTKNAAAYGLRSMRGRMRKMALDVLVDGYENGEPETSDVCRRALGIIKKRWPERFGAEVVKHVPELQIREVPSKRGRMKRPSRKNGLRRSQ